MGGLGGESGRSTASIVHHASATRCAAMERLGAGETYLLRPATPRKGAAMTAHLGQLTQPSATAETSFLPLGAPDALPQRVAGRSRESRLKEEGLCMKDSGQNRVTSPWLNGVVEAAAYARVRESTMRRYINVGKVVSRLKLPDEDGRRPRGLYVYAPSIDQLILEQPSGAKVPEVLR